MRCTNCGLPLSPTRVITNCPRCGFPVNPGQSQGGWGKSGMPGPAQANPWNQGNIPGGHNAGSNPFAQQQMPGQGWQRGAGSLPQMRMGMDNQGGPGWQQEPFLSQNPYAPQQTRKNSQLWIMITGLCIILGALLLVFITVLSHNARSTTPNTGNTGIHTSTPGSGQATIPPGTATASASPTVDGSPSPGATVYPGQQYIDGAQMASGIDPTSMQPQQPTTTFKAGSNMYVIFNVHPPGQGGAVCSSWFLSGKTDPVTSYSFDVKNTTSHASYTYAIFNATGSAYVELYWASTKDCSDKQLAQHVDFTVTA